MESRFEELLVALARARVDFLVVGGIAVALAGFVRATDDVDLLVEPSPANLERLLTVLAGIGEGHARELTPADFADEEGAIRVIEDFAIDVFVRMSGLTYSDLVASRCFATVADARVPYLGPAGLIRLKERSLRERDRADVARLRTLIDREATKSSLLQRVLARLRGT